MSFIHDDTASDVGISRLPLRAGDDEENDLRRVAEMFEYETVAASQTAQVLGTTGATGDYISHLVVVVSTAATAAVSLLDGATSIPVFPNNPGGGIGTYHVPLKLRSISGPLKITTGAGVAVIAVGLFS